MKKTLRSMFLVLVLPMVSLNGCTSALTPTVIPTTVPSTITPVPIRPTFTLEPTATKEVAVGFAILSLDGVDVHVNENEIKLAELTDDPDGVFMIGNSPAKEGQFITFTDNNDYTSIFVVARECGTLTFTDNDEITHKGIVLYLGRLQGKDVFVVKQILLTHGEKPRIFQSIQPPGNDIEKFDILDDSQVGWIEATDMFNALDNPENLGKQVLLEVPLKTPDGKPDRDGLAVRDMLSGGTIPEVTHNNMYSLILPVPSGFDVEFQTKK